MPDDVVLNQGAEPFEPEPPTPEQIEEWERERAAREAAKIAGAVAEKRQVDGNTGIIAEHDDLIADVLYELTLSDIGV